MYEQRQKPKKKIKDNNRQDTRSGVTNKSSNRPKIGDDFFARPSNGLLQRQPQGQVKSIVPDYFRARYGTIQRMAVMLSAAEMLALVARLVAGLVGGVTLTKSLEELNQSPEFERMTDTQKMMVYAVLYKVANKQNFNKQEPNKTETLPTEHKARLTTGGSEITEQGTTTTSRPMTDQAILDLLGPIPAPDDMALDSRTGLPIVDDLGLGLVYGEERDDSATATGQAETLVDSDSKSTVRKTSVVLGKDGVPGSQLTWSKPRWDNAVSNADADFGYLPPVRQQYVNKVEDLKLSVDNMLANGVPIEDVGRYAYDARNDIKLWARELTPPEILETINTRNLLRPGYDLLGPKLDYLLDKGKSWEQIIESATRSGGGDLF